MAQEATGSSPTPLGVVGRTILGVYMVVLPILLGYLVFALWPRMIPDASGNIPQNTINLFSYDLPVSTEMRFILLVIAVSALGSYIQAATSFADYVGNRRIYTSWVWWYILRTFIGAPLALIFYFALRGGLLSAGAEAKDISPFGVAAAAGLVGMFSKQATDKLRELADNLFRTATPDERGDKLTHPVPEITSIDPDTIQREATGLSVKVNGNFFVPESVVRFNGVERPTTFVSATQLTAPISEADRATPGETQVTVFNPSPGGGTSNAVVLRIQQTHPPIQASHVLPRNTRSTD
jgi:hypothetical protein